MAIPRVIRFVGEPGKQAVEGVPPRDLTRDEYLKLPGEARSGARASGLYDFGEGVDVEASFPRPAAFAPAEESPQTVEVGPDGEPSVRPYRRGRGGE